MTNKKLLAIVGPTATGKSGVAVELAKRLNGEVVSADSLQFYKFMDIGTAKITIGEMDGVFHHLIDIAYPDEPISAASYQQMAREVINSIHNRGKLPILVGGSGFYINSVLYDVKFDETSSNVKYRDELYELHSLKGTRYIYEMLFEVDPDYARLHEHNHVRMIRGLEFYYQTGKRISQHNEVEKKRPPYYDNFVFILNKDRDLLYRDINKRVDVMIECGLVDEVKMLLSKGYNRLHSPLGSIGYKEILDYLEDKMTLDEAIDKLKQNTRKFAKRQLTWFKNQTEGKWINADEVNPIEKVYEEFITKGI